MSYLTRAELSAMGFAHLGRDVKVSDRAAIYEPEKIALGDFARIDDFCVLNGRVKIGRNVHVTVFNNIAGGVAGIELCDFSTLAYGCCLFATTDDYSGQAMTNSTVAGDFTSVRSAPIEIGRHTILGTHTIVFPGVTIPEGCASAAQTVFRRSVEPWGVYAGNPAVLLRARLKTVLNNEIAYRCLEESAPS